MEKHKCKLCLKSFANGRALGGHMRSHMLNLYLTPKPPPPPHSPPSSSSEEDENDGDDGGYELMENTKKNLRLEDPEFAFPGTLTVTLTSTAAGGGGGGGVGGGSVVLQDRESETETSKKATVRRRSKRIRRQETSWFGDQQHFHELDRNKNQNQWRYLKKSKIFKPSSKTADSSTPEPVSSISYTSPEEDVAYCLMMLSRDKWTDEEEEEDREHEESDNESESEREIVNVKRAPARTRYRCETCNKVFRSYQALGGHRASHKKIKQSHHDNNNHQTQIGSMEDKIHECPVCFKVFASGQALGGHKRSHVTASSTVSLATAKPVAKQSINLIDLNLPAPIDEEDDEFSQIEVSVVSDGEFVVTH